MIDRYGPKITDSFRVIGEPTTADDAAALAAEDFFQFQAWALGLIGARPAGETKKGGDKGIDGQLFFHDEGQGGATKQIIVSVKAGHLAPTFVRDLIGTVANEDAEMGVLLSFEQPTPGMRATAASAGFYTSPWGKHPKIQLLTIGELLLGKRIDYPPSNATFQQAQPVEPVKAESYELPFGPPAE